MSLRATSSASEPSRGLGPGGGSTPARAARARGAPPRASGGGRSRPAPPSLARSKRRGPCGCRARAGDFETRHPHAPGQPDREEMPLPDAERPRRSAAPPLSTEGRRRLRPRRRLRGAAPDGTFRTEARRAPSFMCIGAGCGAVHRLLDPRTLAASSKTIDPRQTRRESWRSHGAGLRSFTHARSVRSMCACQLMPDGVLPRTFVSRDPQRCRCARWREWRVLGTGRLRSSRRIAHRP